MALKNSGLVDVGWCNQKFTWSNKQHGDTLTKERLDRLDKAVVNNYWLDKFGAYGVEVVTVGSLDHLSILFYLRDTTSQRRPR